MYALVKNFTYDEGPLEQAETWNNDTVTVSAQPGNKTLEFSLNYIENMRIDWSDDDYKGYDIMKFSFHKFKNSKQLGL